MDTQCLGPVAEDSCVEAEQRAPVSGEAAGLESGMRGSGQNGRDVRPVVLPCKALPWQLNPFLGLYLLSCPCAVWLSVGSMSKFPGVPWKLYLRFSSGRDWLSENEGPNGASQ